MASELAFSFIKYAGAGYLVYIGIAMWRSKGQWAFADKSSQTPAKRALFKQSLLLGLSNPKALVFFSALFPQFIQPEQAILPQFLLLAGTSLCNAFVFTSVYVAVAFRFKATLSLRSHFIRSLVDIKYKKGEVITSPKTTSVGG